MSSSGWAVIPTVENEGLSVLQLNVKGLTTTKIEVIRHLTDSNKVAAVLLQETHWVSDDNLKLPGFLLAGSIHSKQYGMATFVRTGLSWCSKEEHPAWLQQELHPGWDNEFGCLLCEHQQASSSEEVDMTATALLQKLDVTRRTRWTEIIESVDFTHSSRKAWQTINQLNTTPRRCPVTADAFASQLLKNGRFPDADKNFARLTSHEVSLSRAASADANLSGDFTAAELSAAISKLKPGKSPGRDNIHPELYTRAQQHLAGYARSSRRASGGPSSRRPVLAGIAPASLRREAATLALARKAQKHDWHILHDTTTTPAPPSRLKSRSAWLAASWKQTWETVGPSRIHHYIWDPGGGVKREDRPRQQWTLLNRLRTGVGHFKSPMKKWGLADSAACECGEPEQTAESPAAPYTAHLQKPPLRPRTGDEGVAARHRVGHLMIHERSLNQDRLFK
ncbi:hypothetical protein SKAU_G00209530 [Synaphobranchus kaupii]|uniref:Endonuclease/exonuclease/phosphatase domain-containing protein n=1 Tax=Synaphobranchus kaupii TaxID=118154 RepID=A0A9Q1IUS7_SYNKA|nr:hypothetical protein SKAU_G00209530 [Synaphobranchus kaupii]